MSFEAFVFAASDQFRFLLAAPAREPELLWITVPLALITLLMTFYFGRYVREKMGWNTALGNSVALIFVGIDLLRRLYHSGEPASFSQLWAHPILALIVVAVMLEGVLLASAAFKHALPEKLLYFFTAPLPVNLQAYVMAVIVYTGAAPSLALLVAAVVLFAALLLALRGVQEVEHLAYGRHAAGRKGDNA